jgi:ribose transport system permease protein
LRRYGTLTGFALMVIFFAINLPETFLTSRNLLNVSQQISMLAVVAFTMTVVMSMGDFDLSVGTMASLAGVVAATLFVAGWPVPWAIAAALAVGVAGGLLNGFLVSILGILPFVATLGTMTVFGGLAFVVSDGRTIFRARYSGRFLGLRAVGDRAGRLAHPGADAWWRWPSSSSSGWCWSRRPTAGASMPSAAISRPRGWPAPGSSGCGCWPSPSPAWARRSRG